MPERTPPPDNFLKSSIHRGVLAANFIMACVYFFAIALLFPPANTLLFWLLIAGEVFHIWQAFAYVHTVWNMENRAPFSPHFLPSVDVFITVAGEPEDIVEQTVRAARAMTYPSFTVFVLNDGKVARKENWRAIENLAARWGTHCITRTVPGGAKAGNINHALSLTHAPFVAVFDADHIPERDFLKKTIGYFADPAMGYVQTPQYYRNRDENYVTGGAWEQQGLFFGPILRGKNAWNAAYMCGTNMVIRRESLAQAGGMQENNITEDFATSIFMQARGWKSFYVPEVLARGLAPEDFSSYCKQQFRWAKGSIDMILRHNPLFLRGLSLGQRIQYAASSSFYLSGLVVAMNALLPIIFLFTGQAPFLVSTMTLAAVFLPYIFLTVYAIQISSGFSFTFRAVSFSVSSFWIYLTAFVSALLGIRAAFIVTPKKKVFGNSIRYAIPHLTYLVLATIGLGIALIREGLSAAVIANLAWVVLTVALFWPFIVAALPQENASAPSDPIKKLELVSQETI